MKAQAIPKDNLIQMSNTMYQQRLLKQQQMRLERLKAEDLFSVYMEETEQTNYDY